MMKRRIYADTSVIGGCVDAEFEKASQLLMETFRRSEATLVISSLTLLELASAPAAVQAVLSPVPEADREYVELTEDAVVLANLSIDAGALGAKNRADAQHIAVATVSRVGVLVSWNFRHIVNLRKIQAYNSVNLREGYPTLEIRTPREVIDHGQD
jgi:predicted nucleic acid-binding protein